MPLTGSAPKERVCNSARRRSLFLPLFAGPANKDFGLTDTTSVTTPSTLSKWLLTAHLAKLDHNRVKAGINLRVEPIESGVNLRVERVNASVDSIDTRI